ncbi:MAG TPA: hypothetical protein VFX06_07025 [Stellaceae bacterium]|nr:hypothetical protein [Stellaceae bacterium]
MRFAALPIIASFALLAAPAFAHSGPGAAANNPYGQTGGVESGYGSSVNQNATGLSGSTAYNQGNPYVNRQFGNQQSSNNGRFGNNQFGNNQFGNQNTGSVSLNTEQKLRQALEQNGFRNVQVTPQAYIIHARAPDGSRVVMEISPDVIAGVVASNPTNNNQRMGMAQEPQQHQNQGMGYGR